MDPISDIEQKNCDDIVLPSEIILDSLYWPYEQNRLQRNRKSLWDRFLSTPFL
jgi:hypothetical protein